MPCILLTLWGGEWPDKGQREPGEGPLEPRSEPTHKVPTLYWFSLSLKTHHQRRKSQSSSSPGHMGESEA